MQTRETLDHDEAFLGRIIAVFGRKHEMNFEDVVRQYREVEAEFVALAGDDEAKVLERKQSITTHLLMDAEKSEQPHAVCQAIWEELLQRGFMSPELRRVLSNTYVRCCMHNAQYDAGLDVLEPLLAEFEQWLQTTALEPKSRVFYCQELEGLHHLRDGLVAYKSSAAEGIAWDERRDAEYDGRDLNYTDREGRDRELDMELNTAMDTIAYTSWPRSFAETTREYRQLEADFVTRLQGADEFFIPETKRRIRSAILMDAHKHKQPFDVCRDVWNELGPLEFRDILQKCAMAWFYADCCLFNKQPDAGLAVIEPLIAQLRNHPPEDTDEDIVESYQEGLARLERLRDKLQAIHQ